MLQLEYKNVIFSKDKLMIKKSIYAISIIMFMSVLPTKANIWQYFTLTYWLDTKIEKEIEMDNLKIDNFSSQELTCEINKLKSKKRVHPIYGFKYIPSKTQHKIKELEQKKVLKEIEEYNLFKIAKNFSREELKRFINEQPKHKDTLLRACDQNINKLKSEKKIDLRYGYEYTSSKTKRKIQELEQKKAQLE